MYISFAMKSGPQSCKEPKDPFPPKFEGHSFKLSKRVFVCVKLNIHTFSPVQ